ncbi:hypothetical protein K504DRAFT_501385 [Pleomassaria siparia CBS 279.74]|uniref:Uncharacterized protein n=1 Tax=Pleomassaria siparia CBS 279.74 TaxID=1314801 RepID=A0A6G1KCM9_9PLEO|nr:hypothetical protein K504DRAFT_501385 [Pleomassaria siparia CBS 279.74]
MFTQRWKLFASSVATTLFLYVTLFTFSPLSSQDVPAFIDGSYRTEEASLTTASGKILMVVSRSSEGTSWLGPSIWQRAIYVVDEIQALLHTDRDKGHEATACHSYIIDNYGHLSSTMVSLP